MKFAGILYLKVNGEQLYARGDFTYNVAGIKRETHKGVDGHFGYTESPTVAYIEGELSNHKELDTRYVANITDATLTLELDIGKTIILYDAAQVGNGDVNATKGTMKIRFEGSEGDE